jgi:hypothetical protein
MTPTSSQRRLVHIQRIQIPAMPYMITIRIETRLTRGPGAENEVRRPRETRMLSSREPTVQRRVILRDVDYPWPLSGLLLWYVLGSGGVHFVKLGWRISPWVTTARASLEWLATCSAGPAEVVCPYVLRAGGYIVRLLLVVRRCTDCLWCTPARGRPVPRRREVARV